MLGCSQPSISLFVNGWIIDSHFPAIMILTIAPSIFFLALNYIRFWDFATNILILPHEWGSGPAGAE